MRFWVEIALMVVAAAAGALLYPGARLEFLLFSVVFFAVLHSGIFLPFQYTHFFFAITWFLGIWLKPVVHFAFAHYGFAVAALYFEPVGSFDASPGAWDQVVLVASIGGLGYLAGRLASLTAARAGSAASALLHPPRWYIQFRGLIWAGFAILLLVIVVVNLETGLIVRGFVARIQLPWPLGGLFSWTTDIGFALLISVAAAWDRAIGTGVIRGFVALCVEGAVLSIATNSRGIYLFHTLPVLLSEGRTFSPLRLQLRRSGALLAIWLMGAVAIPVLATAVRGYMAIEDNAARARASASASPVVQDRPQVAPSIITRYAIEGASRLVIDRWPGLEGLMSVVSYPDRGLALFKEAALQRRTYGMVDVYTGKISKSDFTEELAKRYHNATLAGPVAFFFYSGSLWLVFGGMAFLSALMSILEFIWARLVRDPLIVAMSGFYLSMVVLQLSTGAVQAATGPIAVTALLLMVWCFGRLTSCSKQGQGTENCPKGAL